MSPTHAVDTVDSGVAETVGVPDGALTAVGDGVVDEVGDAAAGLGTCDTLADGVAGGTAALRHPAPVAASSATADTTSAVRRKPR